ncbi:hypothetical protein Arub01_48290 [Actinomadura rubrobrunea]|uniref:Transposase n=1 Tax=Actinomadura rubrobrunea TaxID=115335 RepID=A0A9W6PYR3_9ACTN|nr:hypothetical protein Arub01_48290 [Actinomadura rubrobrunea]
MLRTCRGAAISSRRSPNGPISRRHLAAAAVAPGARQGSTGPSSSDTGVVERCVNRLKRWRGIATRFDKLARNFRATVVLLTALFWINE